MSILPYHVFPKYTNIWEIKQCTIKMISFELTCKKTKINIVLLCMLRAHMQLSLCSCLHCFMTM